MVPSDLHILVSLPPLLEYGLDLEIHFKQIEYSKAGPMSPQRLGYKKALACVLGALSHSFTHLL